MVKMEVAHTQGGIYTPYIRMMGMIVIFLGTEIGYFIFLGVSVQVKSFKEITPVFVRV